jgi:hypothetical protein
VNFPKDTPSDGYEVKACAPKELTRADLESCFAIIGDGGAVNVNTMRRDLPNSSLLAIACTGGRIVGVGAIKPVRKPYAAKVAKNSGVEFPPDTLELGYVAVQSAHRNRGLSQRIVLVLVSSLADRLFATTDEENAFKSGIFEKGQRMAWAERNAVILGAAVICCDRDQTALSLLERFRLS